jgi:hypothetical protein
MRWQTQRSENSETKSSKGILKQHEGKDKVESIFLNVDLIKIHTFPTGSYQNSPSSSNVSPSLSFS